MRDPYLLLYQSPELASDSNTYIDDTREASARGAKRICHYHAMPNAFKGIEPRIALPYSSVSLSSQSEVTLPKITVKSQSVSILDQPSKQRTEDSLPPSRLEEFIQDARSGLSEPVRAMEDELPQGDGKDLIPWSDVDVDGSDSKNMVDYDPWQDESTYESTPEPDAMAQSLEDLSCEDRSCIRRYVMLHSTQGRERTISAEEISGRRIPYLQARSFPPRSCVIITFHKSASSVRKNMNTLKLTFPFSTSPQTSSPALHPRPSQRPTLIPSCFQAH